MLTIINNSNLIVVTFSCKMLFHCWLFSVPFFKTKSCCEKNSILELDHVGFGVTILVKTFFFYKYVYKTFVCVHCSVISFLGLKFFN